MGPIGLSWLTPPYGRPETILPWPSRRNTRVRVLQLGHIGISSLLAPGCECRMIPGRALLPHIFPVVCQAGLHLGIFRQTPSAQPPPCLSPRAAPAVLTSSLVVRLEATRYV